MIIPYLMASEMDLGVDHYYLGPEVYPESKPPGMNDDVEWRAMCRSVEETQ